MCCSSDGLLPGRILATTWSSSGGAVGLQWNAYLVIQGGCGTSSPGLSWHRSAGMVSKVGSFCLSLLRLQLWAYRLQRASTVAGKGWTWRWKYRIHAGGPGWPKLAKKVSETCKTKDKWVISSSPTGLGRALPSGVLRQRQGITGEWRRTFGLHVDSVGWALVCLLNGAFLYQSSTPICFGFLLQLFPPLVQRSLEGVKG